MVVNWYYVAWQFFRWPQ